MEERLCSFFFPKKMEVIIYCQTTIKFNQEKTPKPTPKIRIFIFFKIRVFYGTIFFNSKFLSAFLRWFHLLRIKYCRYLLTFHLWRLAAADSIRICSSHFLWSWSSLLLLLYSHTAWYTNSFCLIPWFLFFSFFLYIDLILGINPFVFLKSLDLPTGTHETWQTHKQPTIKNTPNQTNQNKKQKTKKIVYSSDALRFVYGRYRQPTSVPGISLYETTSNENNHDHDIKHGGGDPGDSDESDRWLWTFCIAKILHAHHHCIWQSNFSNLIFFFFHLKNLWFAFFFSLPGTNYHSYRMDFSLFLTK